MAAPTTVPEVTPAAKRHTANGATLNFSYNFAIETPGDIVVFLDDAQQLYQTHYWLTGVGSTAGGEVQFTFYPWDGAKVTILRAQDIQQAVNLLANSSYSPSTIAAMHNRHTAVDQMLAERIARAPKFLPKSSQSDIPISEPASNKLLGWNNASPWKIENKDTSVITGGGALLSNNTPSEVQYASNKGTSTEISRSDHIHGSGVVSLRETGGVADCTNGNNGTDNTQAFQDAIIFAKAHGAAIFIPPEQGAGYRIDSPLDVHEINNLMIYGGGAIAPTFGLATTPPTQGSMIYANTGGTLFGGIGSNNLLFRDFTVNSLPCTSDTHTAFFLGTSTGAQNGTPGSANNSFENVSIYLKNGSNSCPIYGYNLNLSHFDNVWTLGVYGIMLINTNVLNLTAPFGTLGASIGSIGNNLKACNLLGYGGAPVLYLKTGSRIDLQQVYLATILGGPGYTGQPYAMYMEDCVSVKGTIEVDYFPTAFEMAGICRGIELNGTTFANLTPVGAGLGSCGFFNGISVDDSKFKIFPFGTYPNANYHYVSVGGATPTMTQWLNCEFSIDTTVSVNGVFFNAASGITPAFRNLTFASVSDSPVNTFEIDGAGAAAGDERGTVNGVAFGSG